MSSNPTSRREFLKHIALGLSTLTIPALSKCSGSSSHRNPNIIYILADDLGYGDLSCYGAEKISTPNIDCLSSQGIRFTDAHSPSALCSPTRYGVLTGQYCWRTKLKEGVLRPYDLPLIERKTITVSDLLRENGYHTGIIGKWHLGWEWPVKDGYATEWEIGKNPKGNGIDLLSPLKGGPLSVGFDHQFGVDVPNYPPYCFIENGKILGEIPHIQKPDVMYGNPGVMQKGWDLYKVLPTMTDKAVEFIENHVSNEPKRPFFLYFPLTAPHVPLVPDVPYQSKSDAGMYGDFVIQIDNIVGNILNTIDALKIRDNTITIFTSDNGSPGRTFNPIRGKHYGYGVGSIIKEYNHYPNGNLRGFKGDIWEGGHRVPFIISWPQKLKQGIVNDQLICLTDFISTCAAILNIKLSISAGEDSFNILPTLFNPDIKIRESIVHHSGGGMFAIRKGKWKLILGKGCGSCYSAFYDPEGEICEFEGQLYDLETDLSETNNLYGQYPEIVSELTHLLNEIKSGNSTERRLIDN